jgi:hypothetical protein
MSSVALRQDELFHVTITEAIITSRLEIAKKVPTQQIPIYYISILLVFIYNMLGFKKGVSL